MRKDAAYGDRFDTRLLDGVVGIMLERIKLSSSFETDCIESRRLLDRLIADKPKAALLKRRS